MDEYEGRPRGFFLMHAITIKSLNDELNSLLGPHLTRSLLFRFGFKNGHMTAKEMHLVGQGETAQEYMEEIWIELGLAEPLMVEQKEKGLVIKLEETLESSFKLGACNYTRGFIAGLITGITGIPYECVEEDCVSRGDKACLFILKQTSKIGK